MVYQVPPNIVDIKVCNISFERHCNSDLNQQKNARNFNGRRSNPRAIMADNQSKQQPLPVVEIRPFTKKVWRREKSLPDFYEKKTQDETSNCATSRGPALEVTPATSRLIRELTETRKSLETRQNTIDSSLAKYRSHPRAEFFHESTKSWRKQDLIPSFITRFERTKTSMELLSKENSFQRFSLSNNVLWDNNESSNSNFNGMKVKGGKMNQHIHRRHFLYLNPLDTYRHPNSWGAQFNSTDNSRHSTGRHNLIPSRNSFPLTSGRARELVLAGSQFNHPLKPIQREDTESPHKFNNKLGAAKCSLQILNKLGAPTKLEKTLEKEFELNLERFRKDRLFLPHDLKNLSNGYVPFESNPTIGETFIRNGLEANKPKKRHHHHGDGKMLGLVRQDSNGWYSIEKAIPDIQRIDTDQFVNQTMHPIDAVLHEEAEIRLHGEHSIVGDISKSGSNNIGEFETLNLSKMDVTQSANEVINQLYPLPLRNINSTDENDNKTKRQTNSEFNIEMSRIDSLNLYQNILETSLPDSEPSRLKRINHDNNSVYTTPSTTINSPVVTSGRRLDINADDLRNLQRKSKSASPVSQNVSVGKSPTEMNNSEVSEVPSRYNQNGHLVITGEIHVTDQSTPNVVENHSQNISDSAILPQQNPVTSSCVTHDLEFSNSARINTLESGPQTERLSVAKDNTNVVSGSKSDRPNYPSSSENQHDIDIDNANSFVTGELDAAVRENHPGVLVPPTSEHESNSNPKSLTEENIESVSDEGRNEDGDISIVESPSNLMPLNIKEQTQLPEQNESTLHSQDINEKKVLSNREINYKTDTLTELGDEGGVNKSYKNLSPDSELEISSANRPEIKTGQSPSFIPEDEGISMATPIETAVLDTSMTEACSDQEGVMSGCVDNGDSGVSTTFITADESRVQELEGLMVYD